MNIRQIISSGLITLIAFGAVLYASCNKNKCGGVVCLNSGLCTNNVCICATGYEGNTCQTAWTTEYTGLYSCTKTCSPSVNSTTWQSNVAPASSNGGYTISITNFDNSISSLAATVDSANHITITPAAGTSGITGTGTYDANAGKGVITIRYSLADAGGQSTSSCVMTMTKQ